MKSAVRCAWLAAVKIARLSERLVESARSDRQTQLVVLLGGEAGLRCGPLWRFFNNDKSPATSASFFARVHRFTCRSRFNAAARLS